VNFYLIGKETRKRGIPHGRTLFSYNQLFQRLVTNNWINISLHLQIKWTHVITKRDNLWRIWAKSFTNHKD